MSPGLKSLIGASQTKDKAALPKPKIYQSKILENYPAALEIGSSSIKLMQVSRTQSGYEITKADYLALGRAAPAASSLKKILEKMVKDNQLSGEIATSLPVDRVQTFNFTLPNMPETEIDSAVSWKLKQSLGSGLSIEDAYFDYVVCLNPKDKFNKEINILVFLVFKEAVNELSKMFKELSLELVSVEPKSYAVAECLSWLKKIKSEETVLILHLGASRSAVLIVSGGNVYMMRPVSISGNTFTEAIANYYRLEWQKAENLKRQEGIRDYAKGPGLPEENNESSCLAALSSQLEGLVVDIEHTFKYFSHQLTKSQVTTFDRIVLCGGGSALSGLEKFLSDKVDIPAETFNPLNWIGFCRGQEFNPAVKENGAGFISTLGIASRFIEA